MQSMIYKILTLQAAAQLQAYGTLTPIGVDAADGYVHFSSAAQLNDTLDKHYGEHGALALLAVKAATLGDALVWEAARDGDLFPHLYAPFTQDMVAAQFALNAARDGLQDWLSDMEEEEE